LSHSQSPERTVGCRLGTILCCLVLIAAFGPHSWVSRAAADPQGGPDDPWTLCARYAAEIEMRDDLPPYLLSAISKVESGRWLAADGSVHAWPWTVSSGGKGKFYATIDQAVAAVLALQASGRQSIDVGCMQINLLHHPDAFENLWVALDPARNIAYAAHLLQRLQGEARSWPKAVAYYHSRTSSLNRPYRQKVFRFWHEEWRQANAMAPAATVNVATALVPAEKIPVAKNPAEKVPAEEIPAEKVSADLVSADWVADGQDAATAVEAAAGRDTTDPLTVLAEFSIEEGKEVPGLGQVQLGAFRVVENARSVWAKVLQDNAGLLGDLQPRIDVVDRGELGTLHLLRVSPIMNVTLARSICNELRHRSVDCLVVEPAQHFAFHQFGGPFQ
jgi:hypothetical protein